MNPLYSVLIILLNFFFLDRDPKKCARYHGDKHLNKMILEYAQIASTVFWKIAPSATAAFPQTAVYKATHTKHPIIKWASSSVAHLGAVIELGLALGEERSNRLVLARKLGKKWAPQHSSVQILEFLKHNLPPKEHFEQEDMWMDPPLCMPECLRNKGTDVVDCYRLYYSGHKVQLTKLKWEPYTNNPPFLESCKERIKVMPDVLDDIQKQLLLSQQRQQEKPKKKKIKIA
jgi:hypothetical protein